MIRVNDLVKVLEELSTGMKQKAAIAVNLVHDPEVIVNSWNIFSDVVY